MQHLKMKSTITIIILLITITNCISQDSEKFAQKISAKMCDCVGSIDTYENLKSKLDSCYDKEINEAAIHATSDEIKIIGNIDEFKKVKLRIGIIIKTNCPIVKKLVEAEAQPTSTTNPYPTNFDSGNLKDAITHPEEWDGRIISFDGEIVEVNYITPNKPYFKVKLKSGEIIWVGSMVNSKYDKVANLIRFLGYFSLTSKDDISTKYHDLGFHILSFGELNLKTNQLAFMPGSESQIKEWGKGQVPKGK
jgi:hypothetical protein